MASNIESDEQRQETLRGRRERDRLRRERETDEDANLRPKIFCPLATRRECYQNRRVALSSDSHFTALGNAREWYGAANQLERTALKPGN